MSEKVNILGKAVEKVSLDRDFIAYFMKRYLESENISQQEMLLQLRCSEEDYYKLCLCVAPDTEAGDFLSRITNICTYAHIPVLELSRIIKRANAILKFSEDQEKATNFLMAARDKHNDNKTEG